MEVINYVGFLLKDKKGRFLLQLRTKDAPVDADCWAIFGGKMREDETPEKAVIREMYEEIGIKPVVKFFKKYSFEESDGMHRSHLFVGEVENDIRELKDNLMEGAGVDLFSEKDIGSLNLANSSKMILRDFVGQNTF